METIDFRACTILDFINKRLPEDLMFYPDYKEGDYYNLVAEGDSEISYSAEVILCDADWLKMLFTGWTDNNKVKIYEGDIIQITCNSYSDDLGQAEGQWIGFVYWNKEKASFVIRSGRLEWNFHDRDFNNKAYMFEIIGNVYQNPDLLV